MTLTTRIFCSRQYLLKFSYKKFSESEDEICPPPQIMEIAVNNLLPKKFRSDKFMNWKEKNNIKSFSENVDTVGIF
jgi:hypothetical protein